MNALVSPAITGLAEAVPLFLVATGLSIVYRVTGTVNFAQGAFFMIGAYASYAFAGDGDAFGLMLAIVMAAVLVGLLGFVVEFALMRRTYRLPLPLQLLSTFAVALIAQDIIMEIWGAEPLTSAAAAQAAGALQQAPVAVPVSVPTYDLVLIAIVPVVLFILWFLHAKSPWSTHIRAIIHDSQMVAILGIRKRWMFSYAVIVGAALAGLAGALQMPRAPIHLGMDEQMLAQAFIVMVVGSLGSVIGALVAAIVVGQLSAFGGLIMPGGSAVLLFLVIAIFVAARPQGLFGGVQAPPERSYGAGDRPPTLPRIVFLTIFIGALIMLAAVPLANNPDLLLVANEILIFVLFAASLQFLIGQGSMASFGHALYLGLGAYASAVLVRYLALPLESVIVLAPVAATLGVLLIGWFSVRLSGVYLAMLTLVFAQLGWSVSQFFAATANGGDLLLSGTAPVALFPDQRIFYGMTLALVVFALILIRQVSQSPFGLALRACRDCPERAAALGLDMTGLRWTATILAGVFAGLAGGLLAYLKSQNLPDIAPVAASTEGLVMVLLGGIQTMLGPIVGATIYTTLKSLLVTNTEFWRLLIGLIIIAFVLLLPRGLIGGLSQLMGSRR